MGMTKHPAALPGEQLLEACRVTRQRRSGPGGQHRNKVETAVVIEHVPSGIRGQASERRSQAENQSAALFRLRLNLAVAWRSPGKADSPATVSQLWQSRARGGRVAVSAGHDDFPALLAEVLEAFGILRGDLAAAAAHFGVTSSQLVRFVAQHRPALIWLNALRTQHGLRELKG